MGKDEDNSDERTQTTVELTPTAMELVDAYVKKRGGRGLKKTVLSKLVEWFAGQEDSVKSGLMGWVDEDMSLVYAEMFEQMARDLRAGHPKGGVVLPKRDKK